MRLRQLVQEAFSTWSDSRPTQLAAGLAYYGLISLGPLLFIIFTVPEVILGRKVFMEQVGRQIADSLGPEHLEFFVTLMESATATTLGDSPLLTIVSVILLLYGASGLFSELRFAFNRVWQVPRAAQKGARNYAKQRSIALLMLVGISFLVILLIQVDSVFTSFYSTQGADQTVRAANELAIVVLLTLALALVFKAVPATHVRWRDVWLGSVITAISILLAFWLVLAFIRDTKIDSILELTSFIVLILTAIYILSLIVILGAVICKAFADTFGPNSGQLGPD